MSDTLTRGEQLLNELGRDIGTSKQLADRTGIQGVHRPPDRPGGNSLGRRSRFP